MVHTSIVCVLSIHIVQFQSTHIIHSRDTNANVPRYVGKSSHVTGERICKWYRIYMERFPKALVAAGFILHKAIAKKKRAPRPIQNNSRKAGGVRAPRGAGDTTPCRVAGVTLHSHVRYTEI